MKVGQTTIIRGDDIRTGVTAILPHDGNLFQEKVPGAVFVGNAFGKLMGSTQVNELGEIETPIILTNTLAVPRAADALLTYMLSLPGNENVRSVNALVGETNDGYLNDIRGRHSAPEDVLSAIRGAKSSAVEEGTVGAGTGTVAFMFKGGIGTSSRKLPASMGGYTVGVLVQSNFGGVLTIAGAPVGVELGRYEFKDKLPKADGSIMIVIATDAPVHHRNLSRMAARAMMGLGRTGAAGSNGSGDYVIAFSTAESVRVKAGERGPGGPPERAGAPVPTSSSVVKTEEVANDDMSPLFLAVIEATEEAIYNSLFKATAVKGYGGHSIDALPIEKTVEILKQHKAIGE